MNSLLRKTTIALASATILVGTATTSAAWAGDSGDARGMAEAAPAEALDCEATAPPAFEDPFYDGPSASYLYDGLFSKAEPTIPEHELDHRIPQGTATWINWDDSGKDLLLVTAYSKVSGATAHIIGLDPNSGEHVGSVAIDESHVGGIVVGNGWAFVQGHDPGNTIRKYRLSDLEAKMKVAETEGKVPFLDSVGDARQVYGASFMSSHNGVLWAGKFNEHDPDFMEAYTINDDGSLTRLPWLTKIVPPKTQGLLVTEEQFIYSTSLGRTNYSKIYVVDRNETDPEGAYCFVAPSMSEGLTAYEGNAYLVFESAAYYYRGDVGDRALNVIPGLHKAPISGLTQLVDDSDVQRASIACSTPSTEVTNYSWGTNGSFSTTVYFNNHCADQQSVKLHFSRTSTECMTTNGGTQGRDTFGRTELMAITQGC